jgi:hypothetical protein
MQFVELRSGFYLKIILTLIQVSQKKIIDIYYFDLSLHFTSLINWSFLFCLLFQFLQCFPYFLSDITHNFVDQDKHLSTAICDPHDHNIKRTR